MDTETPGGAAMPRLGLGTSRRDSPDGLRAIKRAVELGYRHIDTAQNYGTESHVGQAVRESGLPRGDFFITTKVDDRSLRRADFLASVPRSLERLGMDQVDLLLVHWPVPDEVVPLEEYLTALAEAQQRGWTRLIGVSNFTIAHLDRVRALLGEGAIATNQVEIHPFLQVPRMRDYARGIGLLLTAYQPLAKATVGEDPVLRQIGQHHGVPAATVSLAFLLAEGHAVIPSASGDAHLMANLAARDLVLASEELEAVRGLDRGGRRINPAKSPRWDD